MTNIIAQITADLDNGGWESSGIVYNDANILSYNQQLNVWYNLFTQNGWTDIAPAFLGHIQPDIWTKVFQSSEAPWKGYTAQEFLKQGDIQGIYFKDTLYPANSHQITNMKFSDIVYHILTEHCNLVTPTFENGILKLNIDSANSADISSWEIKDGNFWTRLQEIAKAEFYTVYVDKSNTLNYIPHPMFGTLPDIVLSLTSDLLSEPLQFDKRNVEAIGQIILHGNQPDGTQVTGTYPTNPEPGPIIKKGGYLIDNDTDLDVVAQRMYLFDTRQYTVTAKIGNGIGLMLELLDRIGITYTSIVDGINWSNKAFYINRITVNLMDNFTAETELVLEEENTA